MLTRLEMTPPLLYSPLVARLSRGGVLGWGWLTADGKGKLSCIESSELQTSASGVWVDMTDELWNPSRISEADSVTEALNKFFNSLRTPNAPFTIASKCAIVLVFHRCTENVSHIRHSFYTSDGSYSSTLTVCVKNSESSLNDRILLLLEKQQEEISRLTRQMARLLENRKKSQKNNFPHSPPIKRRVEEVSQSSSAWSDSDADTVRPVVRADRGTDVQRGSLDVAGVRLAATDDEGWTVGKESAGLAKSTDFRASRVSSAFSSSVPRSSPLAFSFRSSRAGALTSSVGLRASVSQRESLRSTEFSFQKKQTVSVDSPPHKPEGYSAVSCSFPSSVMSRQVRNPSIPPIPDSSSDELSSPSDSSDDEYTRRILAKYSKKLS